MNKNNSIVGINIINENTKEIITKTPIFFNWNEEGSLEESLTTHEVFIKWLTNKNVFSDIALYSCLCAYYCQYFYETGEYEEYFFNIQDIYDVNHFSSRKTLILSILQDIYKNSKFFEEYSLNDPSEDSQIRYIVKMLKEKYKEKLNIETMINYIREQLTNKYKLNEKNIDILIELTQKILNV